MGSDRRDVFSAVRGIGDHLQRVAGRRDAGSDRYRGPDRRPAEDDDTGSLEWSLGGLSLVAVALTSIAFLLSEHARALVMSLASHVRVATLALVVVLAFASYAARAVTGEVRAYRIATAAWLLAAMTSLDLVDPAFETPLSLTRWALSATAALWLVAAVRGPDVDTWVRGVRDLGAAVTATLLAVAVTAVAQLFPWIAPRTVTVAVGCLALVGWVVAAGWSAATTLRVRSYLGGWAPWAIGTMATAEVLGMATRTGVLVESPAFAVRAGAVFLATLGTVLAIRRSAVGRRGEVYRARQLERSRDEARRSRDAEREHEIRNTLLAVEGATHILRQHRGELPPEVEEQLTETVADQLAALREMVTAGRDRDERPQLAVRSVPPTPITTGDELARLVHHTVVALARARGLVVELEISELPVPARLSDVTAVGGVLGNLLRNAEIHGAGNLGSRIDVELHGGTYEIQLSVRDHGFGVAEEDRGAIFERGVRCSTGTDGDGLGLHIARRSMRELGGDLRHEQPAGGGARFVATLPTVRAAEVDTLASAPSTSADRSRS